MVKHILTHSAYWTINKKLARQLGIEEALLLTDIIDKYFYFEGIGQLQQHKGESYFYCTGEAFEKDIGLTYKVQQRCFKKLKDMGLIITAKWGVPARTHYSIRQNQIIPLVDLSLSQREELNYPDGHKQFSPEGKTINNNKQKNKRIRIKEENKEAEASGPSPYAEFLLYLNSTFSRSFRGESKSESQFRARIKSGYTLEDLCRAAEVAHSDSFHKNTQFKYLTPEFLTRPDKLEQFLNRKIVPADQTVDMFTEMGNITHELLNRNSHDSEPFSDAV